MGKSHVDMESIKTTASLMVLILTSRTLNPIEWMAHPVQVGLKGLFNSGSIKTEEGFEDLNPWGTRAEFMLLIGSM